MALQANVPIGLGYLDYHKKEAGIARLLWPSGDIEKDMREIMAFYASISPRYSNAFSLDERYAGGSVDSESCRGKRVQLASRHVMYWHQLCLILS